MSATIAPRRQIMPVRIVKRKEDQSTDVIRSNYYQKLGVFPSLPTRAKPSTQLVDDQSITSSSSSSSVSFSPSLSSSLDSSYSCDSRPPLVASSSCSSFASSRSLSSPSCLRHKRSVLHTTPAKHARISFHPEVKLYRIKSHEDYSDQEWNNMWVDGETLDYAKDRNAFEFQADDADWQNATEEDAFMEGPDGELVHPATWVAYRHQWEQTGSCAGKINFAALLAAQQRPNSRRGRRSSWSPRPTQQRKKSFWLLDLAIQSVQKGKDQAKSRQHSTTPAAKTYAAKPCRHTDQGFP